MSDKRVEAACFAAGALSGALSDVGLTYGGVERARKYVDELREALGLPPVDWTTGDRVEPAKVAQ